MTKSYISLFHQTHMAFRGLSMYVGQRSGNLVAVEPIAGGKFWLCQCKCGKTTKASRWHFERGLRKSCGCRKKSKPTRLKCKRCGKTKPREQFYIRKNGVLTRHHCKSCTIIAAKVNSVTRQRQLRLDALSYYSDKQMECACCSETHIEFLAIDHIGGGGNKHRKSENIKNLYRWLKKHNYPIGFRVLCMNCNFSIGAYGYCPHRKFV